MAEAVFFVWRATQHGHARPEIWFGDMVADFKSVPTLAKHRLEGELAWKVAHDAMSLAELVELFPAPMVSE